MAWNSVHGRSGYPLVFGCALASMLGASLAAAEPPSRPSFGDALVAARSDLVLVDGRLSGAGADVLERGIGESRFVLIGEDHFTREIPLLTSAICGVMHPDAYAVEAGPQAAQFVTGLLHRPDRVARMQARMAEYAHSMAFLDAREENETAVHCARASRNKNFALWGLDQEFIGAAGSLLDAMAATGPGPKSRAAIAAVRAMDKAADKAARASGDTGKALMIAATAADLQPLVDAVDADGNARTRALLDELVASNAIYRLNSEGSPDSNRVRAELFKQHFISEYKRTTKRMENPRVLFKFGDNHSGKGFSPLQVRDIGNFVAEMADAEKTRSLHVMVLGARGVHASFGGYARPMGREPFAITDYAEYKWLIPAVDAALPANASGMAMTLFDLRTLRFRGIDFPAEWKRIVYSYDLFVLIPELTPAASLDE
ncbi:MAG: hypothetical protein WAS23_07190 [Dokdonella sp.]|uniref:hypothetical protein n=2 Tax=Dokdonella sp. TaxID=2291710 RepID=UPI002BA67794|nr:hypothetical protein [Dokdonella sp.]HPN79513.1 hypothetical protein [Dokdonella sp.]